MPLLHPESASKEAQDVYDDFYRRMAFPRPPNFILTQGHAPMVAQDTWDLVRNVLVSGKIPRWKKELIFVAISKERGCGYCEAAHIACCRMLGVEAGTIEHLVRDVRSISDPALRDLILFATKCAREPREVTEADYACMKSHGLDKAEIMEVIAMAGLAVYANIIADATAMDADPMFASL
jgi:uncharacterized peroxidase-related enzyme